MGLLGLFLPALIPGVLALAGENEGAYDNDFEKSKGEALPADFMPLSGEFVIASENGNKVLKHPGTPLDSFAVAFGPTVALCATLKMRFFGTASGRVLPTAGIGVNGGDGYRIQVSPAKKALEVVKDGAPLASVPFLWKTGTWTCLAVRFVAVENEKWEIQAKAWLDGQPEPAEWPLRYTVDQKYEAAQAVLHASPFSGTPILFDDLKVVPPSAAGTGKQ